MEYKYIYLCANWITTTEKCLSETAWVKRIVKECKEKNVTEF